MSNIDTVQQRVQNYFNHLSGPGYVRILDTPYVWGKPFGSEIMPQAVAREAEFERAIEEIVQKTRYRCDVSSLNSPDPDWVKVILGAMDTSLTKKMGRTAQPQFRFLFGQTPSSLLFGVPNYTDFKVALIRLVRNRSQFWEKMPEIWMGRFYRLGEGISEAIKSKIFGRGVISSDDTKMTWNHSKIIAVDGTETLVGGHNLNMDLFRSYPPVHDVSVVVHGEAAYGSQLFLNKMWQCGTDLLTKEYLDVAKLSWINGDEDRGKPTDPLTEPGAITYMKDQQAAIVKLHQSGVQTGVDDTVPENHTKPDGIRDKDLQTLIDLQQDVFPERKIYNTYDRFQDYKLATRMFAVGKYWNGPNKDRDYQKGSEVMKELLIKSAKRIIRMSQMDLISAWKKNWSDHVVCHWIMEALLANKNLRVQVVVSPLDAGAGAEGDQYSFGSGAGRTFDLIKYYMTHNAETDAVLDDKDGARAVALTRIYIAPFYYTDLVPENKTTEGKTYQWPNLTKEGYTATLKQRPLSENPPKNGIIGSAALSVFEASGYIFAKVPSAPGNHAKIMIIDDELYVVGSDNLYPGSLSEFNYLVEGDGAVNEMLESYWRPLWRYSGPHACRLTALPWRTRLFAALQTSDGHPLLFSIGVDGVFYLVKEQADPLKTVWSKTDLSSAQIKKDFAGQTGVTCRTFDAGQSVQNGSLGLAMIIGTGTGDHLYLSLGNSNKDISWSGSPHWVTYEYDDTFNKLSKLEIVNVFFCETTQQTQYIIVDIVRDTNSAVKAVSRYYIDPVKEKGHYWNKHDLPIDIEVNRYDSCLGRATKGYVDGLYTVGQAGSSSQLEFCPVINAYGDGPPTLVRLNLPGGATASAITATRNADLSTDLFAVSGSTLYYFASANQADGATGTTLFTNAVISGTGKLAAMVHDGLITLWGLNANNQVYYSSCPKLKVSDPSAWSVPLVIVPGIEEMSPYVNIADGSNTIFALGDVKLHRIVQDPSSKLWQTSDITLPVEPFNG